MSEPADRPLTIPALGRRARAVAGLGGVGISGLILLSLHLAQRPPQPTPPIEVRELRAVALPPPPPPRIIVGQEPPPPQLMEMAPLPSTSPVRFALSLEPVDVPRLQAQPRIEFAVDAFRPRTRDLGDARSRVFNAHDVDRLPVPVYRKPPRVPLGLLRAAKSPVVRLTFVVSTDGRVEDVRVVQADPREMGELVAAAVAEWQFEPAVRDGQRVRCVVLQPVRLHPPSGSPFTTH